MDIDASEVGPAGEPLVQMAYRTRRGQTLYLRVYPYNTGGATSGKSLMLASIVVSGVTN